MVPLVSLWLPIVVSAVLVFLASSIIHMLLPYHRSDYGKLPSEDSVMEALRRFAIPPGNYFMPHPGSPKAMKSPEYQEKRKQGPIATLTVMAHGSMGTSLAQWFVFCLVVGVFAAYLAGRALGPGAEFNAVLRFAGTAAFLGYGLALWQNTIWYKLAWSVSLKQTFDALIYALLTGATLAWMWPNG